MLNQSFSFENLKVIHEVQNRKGNYFEEFYSDNYHEIVVLLAEYRKEIKVEKSKVLFNEEKYKELIAQKEALEVLKENYLEEDLNKFSNIINDKNFNFELTPFKPKLKSKTIYTTKKDAVSYFAMKQLQFNIFRTFKVKQANRYQIVKQVKILLQDSFPKFIIRTDIRQFYESVPQYELLKLIETNSLLSPKSKYLIKNLLYNYNLTTNQLHVNEKVRMGIPRGVGISPFLAELYMRKIDEEIKNIEHVTFYGRYVDDIIIMFTPKSKHSNNDYLTSIRKIIEHKGLKIKDGSIADEISKRDEIDLLNNKNTRKDIHFLGYKFQIVNSLLKEVKLSDNKKGKYKDRLGKCIDSYLKDFKYNEKETKKLLIHRFNYLTKNTRLHQPKKGVIGIYYSNSLIEKNCSCLIELDSMLSRIIDTKLPLVDHPTLNLRLKRYSFVTGFADKSFYHINSKKKNIPELRSPKYKRSKPLMNNFEKIVEAWK